MSDDRIPYLAIGNDELERCITAGTHAHCPRCGSVHPIQWADRIGEDGTLEPSRLLGSVHCGDNDYLVAVAGKLLHGGPVA